MEQSQIFMIDLDFNIKDIKDFNFYFKRAKAEAKLCYDTPSTRKGRTWEKVKEAYFQGHPPEVYLIENFNYIDDTRKFKDVFNTKGEPVEIKTAEKEVNVQYKLDELADIKNDPKKAYRNIPNIVYMWLVDVKKADYKYYGKYEWSINAFFNNGSFKQTSTKNL